MENKTVWFTILFVAIVALGLLFGFSAIWNFIVGTVMPILFLSLMFGLFLELKHWELREEERKKDAFRRVQELERRERYDDYMMRAKIAMDYAEKNNVPIPIFN